MPRLPSLEARWPWPRVGLLAGMALAMWGIKRHYAAAEVGDLVWMLKPVASLSALVSGAEFEWEPGSGFLSREQLFVIAKPCAGVNFMVAALGMVGFLLSERARSWGASVRLAALSLGVAYAATVMANTTRIVVALWLARQSLVTAFWTGARLHRAEGIVVYFGMLVALHLLVQRFANMCERVTQIFHWADIPLASYYFVTVLVPFANGSASTGRGFIEHLAFVVLAPLTLVVVVGVIRLGWRRWPRLGVARRAALSPIDPKIV